MTIDSIIDDVIAREGGYSNHPADRGGPTRFGITQATLATWRGHPVSAADVEQLHHDEARAIYQTRYVEDPGFADLPDPVRAALVDTGVLSGPRRAVRWIQEVLDVHIDGVLGHVTRQAIVTADADALVLGLARRRAISLCELVRANPGQIVFLTGWVTRALRPLERRLR